MVKRLSSTDQNDNPLVNVPDGVNPQDAVNKRQIDNKVDGTIALYSTATEPTSPNDGDIWVDPDDENYALDEYLEKSKNLSDLSDISAARATLGITALEGSKANTVHTHEIGDVTGLQSTLDGKASTASVAALAIESGSNANGDYTKFPDGTMICWVSGITNGTTWTFPQPFISAPAVIGSVHQALARGVSFSPPSATSVTIAVFRTDDFSNPTTAPASLTAIGRWK
jgi:hypothetical protein